MTCFWGHLFTKSTFNSSVLFSKYLEYICSSSGESGLWESKRETHIIFEHHSLNILFQDILPSCKSTCTLNGKYFSPNLSIFQYKISDPVSHDSVSNMSGSGIRALLTSPLCPFQRVPVLCWAPAASPLPSCQHSQIVASSTSLLWCSSPLTMWAPWWMSDQRWQDENPQQKDDDYRLIRPTCSESAVTKCSVLRVP